MKLTLAAIATMVVTLTAYHIEYSHSPNHHMVISIGSGTYGFSVLTSTYSKVYTIGLPGVTKVITVGMDGTVLSIHN